MTPSPSSSETGDPPSRREPFTHLIWAVPVMMIWGSSYAVIKAGLSETTPLLFAAMRAIPAGLVLLAAYRLRAGSWCGESADIGDWFRVGLLGLLCTGVFFAAMFLGTPRVGAGLAAVLINTQPLFVAAMAAVFLGETLGRVKQISVCVGFLGVVLMVWPRMDADSSADVWGMLILLGGAISFSIGMVLSKRLYQRLDLYWVTGWQLLAGGFFLLILALIQEDVLATRFSSRLFGLLAYISLVGTALTSLVWFRLVRVYPVAVLSSFGFLSPVTGVILAVLFFGEGFSATILSGMGLVVISLYGMGRP